MSEPVDVLLILEGTYPYVSGGVSSWVHALISDLPELRFGILYLASSWQPRPRKYSIPANLVFIQEISALDLTEGWAGDRPTSPRLWQALERFHEDLQQGHWENFGEVYELLGQPGNRQGSFLDLTRGPEMWSMLARIYEKYAREAPFLDFYYCWRASHLPILHLLYSAIPNARVIHTVCTGWAGLLGTLARYRLGRPLLLTEHGIYTNERRIEISQADWLEKGAGDQAFFTAEMGYFKVLWTRLFEALGRLTYDHADGIYTLYRGNRELQTQFGAPRDKIRIVPNGVRVQRFEGERPALPEQGPLRVGFVGRVVPIKDVKTLIRAAKVVREQLPRAEFWLLGPYDEDPDYYEECRTLSELLGLGEGLRFFGPVPVADYYPQIHLQVLTSISEGQPLVILEGFCSGLPCVATRVGACAELIDGLTEEDRALGPAGLVTPVCKPEATARAILEILGQPGLYESMVKAAWERVHRFYDHSQMIGAYRRIYSNFGGTLGGNRV